MTEKQLVEHCAVAAKRIRRNVIDMAYAAGDAHLGGSLSMVEMLAALYCGVLRFDPAQPDWAERDRVILSKGHAALAQYPALVEAGILPEERLAEFHRNGSALSVHPSLHGLPGIEMASGSLGQGLSQGVGMCLALRRRALKEPRVFVFLGDGECDEGSVWEAAASASHFRLDQLVAIVDLNGVQSDEHTAKVLDMSPMDRKWAEFGWNVRNIDGHDISAAIEAFSLRTEKPLAIIAHTVKGKGVSFAEDKWQFHHAGMSRKQYEEAIAGLEASNA